MQQNSHIKLMRSIKIVKTVISLGIDGRQWLSSAIICAILLQILSLPSAYAAIALNDPANAEFESANEDLPFLVDAWRKANVEIEARLTPWRFENWSSEVSSDVDNKKKVKTEDKLPAVAANKAHDELPSREVITDESESPSSLKKDVLDSSVIKETESIAPVTFFSQLPDNERDSVYSYENNLGSPKGQVELDSSNQAAALRIRHRAGIANFGFDLPLASLSGRGINAGASMTYNSRTWNKSLNGSGQDHFTYDVDQS